MRMELLCWGFCGEVNAGVNRELSFGLIFNRSLERMKYVATILIKVLSLSFSKSFYVEGILLQVEDFSETFCCVLKL